VRSAATPAAELAHADAATEARWGSRMAEEQEISARGVSSLPRDTGHRRREGIDLPRCGPRRDPPPLPLLQAWAQGSDIGHGRRSRSSMASTQIRLLARTEVGTVGPL
jgi:hypothetical protein